MQSLNSKEREVLKDDDAHNWTHKDSEFVLYIDSKVASALS
jgi:hypothetical protein